MPKIIVPVNRVEMLTISMKLSLLVYGYLPTPIAFFTIIYYLSQPLFNSGALPANLFL